MMIRRAKIAIIRLWITHALYDFFPLKIGGKISAVLVKSFFKHSP